MEPLDLWVQLVNVGPQEEWVPLDSPDATVPSVEPDQQERRENRERKVRSDPQDKTEIRDPWGLWDYLGLLDHRGRMEIRCVCVSVCACLCTVQYVGWWVDVYLAV